MTDEAARPQQQGAIYYVSSDLGGDMRRVTTPVQRFSTRETGRLMTLALIEALGRPSCPPPVK